VMVVMAVVVSIGVAVAVSVVDVVALIVVVAAVDSVDVEAWTEEEVVSVDQEVDEVEVAMTAAAKWTTVATGGWIDVVDDLINFSKPKHFWGVCI